MPIIHTMKRINVHLTEKEIQDLRTLAKKSGLTVSEIIRRAIDLFLGKERRKK